MQFFWCSTIVALAVSCVSGAATQTVKDIVQSVANQCTTAHKASADQAKIAFNQELPKDETERCFLECIYSGIGAIQDGSFSLAGSLKVVDLRYPDPKEKEIATRLFNTCAKEIKEGEEKCHLGQEIRKCFVTHGKTMNFFPSAA